VKQLLTLLLLLNFCLANAASYTLSNTGNWNDPATWGESSNVPGTGDDVTISGAFTVTLTGNVTINSLTFNGSEGSTIITDDGNTRMLTIQGTLPVSTWTSGDIKNTLRLVISSGVTFQLNSASQHKSIFNSAKVVNNGTVEWNGGGIFFYDSGEFINDNIFNNNTIDNKLFIQNYSGTQVVFTNNNIFNCTSNVTYFEVSIKFVNTGTLNINYGFAQFLNAEVANTGTINLNSAVTAPNFHALTNFTGSGGTVNFGVNTTLSIKGTSVLGNITGSSGTIIFEQSSNVTIGDVIPSTISLDFSNSGNITLNVDQTLGNSTSFSKDLDGIGKMTVPSDKTLTWNRGRISGSVELVIDGNLNMATSNGKTIESNAKLTIHGGGQVEYSSSGGFGVGHPAVFTNSGIFNISGDAAITDVSPGGFTASMSNGGSFIKSSGAAIARIEPFFTNSGILSTQSGTIELLRNLTNSGTLKGTGTIKFASSQPSFPGVIAPGLSPGTLTFSNASSIVPTGTLQVEVDGSSVDMLVVSGNLNVTGTALVITEINPLPEGSFFTIARSQSGTLTSPFGSASIPSGYSLSYTATEARILNGILPVELTIFTGQPAASGNQLHWETASEKNTEWHVVERSQNGRDWIEIGRVDAAGTTQLSREYDFADPAPLPVSYYRLRSIDFDGSFQFSNVIVLRRNDEAVFTVKTFPNPAKSFLTLEIHSPVEQDADLFLTDTHGRVVRNDKIHTANGVDFREIQLEDLPGGVYFIEIKTGHDMTAQKFVKQ
jgi:hypothetical protein